MKGKTFLLLLSLLSILTSCSSTTKIVVNRKIITPDGEPMLIGQITRNALTDDTDFSSWYQSEYDSYIPDPKVIRSLKGRNNLHRIEIFFGTWCDDSKVQLPRFMKILDKIRFPKNKITLYAVNQKKESFYGEQAQKNIQLVPTFIIYKSGSEVGRIIETPKQSLELDFYKIMRGKSFTKENKKKTLKPNRSKGIHKTSTPKTKSKKFSRKAKAEKNTPSETEEQPQDEQ